MSEPALGVMGNAPLGRFWIDAAERVESREVMQTFYRWEVKSPAQRAEVMLVQRETILSLWDKCGDCPALEGTSTACWIRDNQVFLQQRYQGPVNTLPGFYSGRLNSEVEEVHHDLIRHVRSFCPACQSVKFDPEEEERLDRLLSWVVK